MIESRWFFVVLALALSQCAKIDCVEGTRETNTKPYAGKSGVTTPHSDPTPTFKAGGSTCTAVPPVCTYFPLARLGLHNPTGKEVVADVYCDFFVETSKVSSNKRLGVKVEPESSIYVEMQQNVVVEAGMTSSLGASCSATFR